MTTIQRTQTSPPTTLNGRLAPGIHTSPRPPPIQRQTSLGSPSSPLLKTRSPIGTQPYGNPVRKTMHPGCVLCGYVASAGSASNGGASAPPSPINQPISLPTPVRASTPDLRRAGPSSQPFSGTTHSNASSLSSNTPQSPTTLRPLHLVPFVSGHRIIYRDDFITVYPAEGKESLCANGRHIVLLLNTHLDSVYELGPGDVPVLSHILNTATRLLLATVARSDNEAERGFTSKDVTVGFVNGMPRDSQFPYSHLHAQAFLGPFDKKLPGSTMWRRNVVYGSLNWWSIEDLRAEIREESSNNRVKSGYDDRLEAPIDQVPDAGALAGPANVLDPDAYRDENGADFARSKARAMSSMDISAGPGTGTGKGKDAVGGVRVERIDSSASSATIRPSPLRSDTDYSPDDGSTTSSDTR